MGDDLLIVYHWANSNFHLSRPTVGSIVAITYVDRQCAAEQVGRPTDCYNAQCAARRIRVAFNVHLSSGRERTRAVIIRGNH